MEFKKLDLGPQEPWYKRFLKSKRLRNTIVFTVLGMGVGAALFFVLESYSGSQYDHEELMKNIIMGGLFGFFVTNSPCASGKC